MIGTGLLSLSSTYASIYHLFLFYPVVKVSDQDGIEGSFGIFGMKASFAGMPNVPKSEGMVWVD
jgi:hypothetical protein